VLEYKAIVIFKISSIKIFGGVSMEKKKIEELADMVTAKKNRLREIMLYRKCRIKGEAEGRVVLKEEITLTKQEKACIMNEALNMVAANFPAENRRDLKRVIGKELNRRKQERKKDLHGCLDAAIKECDDPPEIYTKEAMEEIKLAEETFRREEEIANLIQIGKAARDEDGNLIIFDTEEVINE
jgi:hypothetical protein